MTVAVLATAAVSFVPSYTVPAPSGIFECVPRVLGVVVTVSVRGLCLHLGARYLKRCLRLNPAMLLRSGG